MQLQKGLDSMLDSVFVHLVKTLFAFQAISPTVHIKCPCLLDTQKVARLLITAWHYKTFRPDDTQSQQKITRIIFGARINYKQQYVKQQKNCFNLLINSPRE